MCLSATFGLTGWLQDTQKIWRSVSSPSPSVTWEETDRSDRATGRSHRDRQVRQTQCLVPPRAVGPAAVWRWRWCLRAHENVFPSVWGGVSPPAVPSWFAPAVSAPSPLQCRDSAATAGSSEARSRRYDWDRDKKTVFSVQETTLSSLGCQVYLHSLGGELHPTVLRAVFRAGPGWFDTSWTQTLPHGPAHLFDPALYGSLAVPHALPVPLLHFVAPWLHLLFRDGHRLLQDGMGVLVTSSVTSSED